MEDKAKKEIQLKLFDSGEPPREFLRDLDAFFGLQRSTREQVQDFFVSRERQYSPLKSVEERELMRLTALPKEEVENVVRAVRFLITRLAGRFSVEGIVQDLEKLGRKLTEIEAVRKFLTKVVAEHPNLKKCC